MMMRRFHTILAVILVPIWMSACGGGDTTMDVRKPAAERPDFDKTAAARGALKIPASDAFNYTSFRSGQSGSGRGESKPDGKSGATCHAEAAEGSDAWGEFQLGFCFDNSGDAPLDAVVKLNVKVTEKSQLQGGDDSNKDQPAPVAKGTLTFFIKDSNGSVIKTENLLANSLGKGPNSAGIVHELAFDARFEANRGYYLMMAGRSEAQAGQGQSASVALGVKDASLEIAWRPAASASASESDKPVAAAAAEGAESAP